MDQEVSANPSKGQGRASLSSESCAENVCLQLPWLLTSGCSLSAAAAAILSSTAAPPQPPLQTSFHDPKGTTELSISLRTLNLPVLDYGDI